MIPTLNIRPAKAEDLESLGHIAYQTGFFGGSAEKFFPSKALFTDLWIRPYLEGAGCCGFVTELENKPVGYILGSCDLPGYRRWMLSRIPFVLGRSLMGIYRQVLPSLPYLLRMTRYPSRLAPPEQYPAGLHINVLPETRGHGLGKTLLQAYLDCLSQQKIRGVQLSTTRENQAAVVLYERMGFKVWQEYSSPLWRPWLGHDAIHLTMVKELD